ncbi:MAG TPA: FKBP-type peptidyl-prolyl cis-trans isomerase [Chitinophagales bacterium]|nr:FKBP-type peptidyl-prolyl cis-trans isomerase [Chitinophagales bacterium]
MKNVLFLCIYILCIFPVTGQNSDDKEYSHLFNGTAFKITHSIENGSSPKKGDYIKMSLEKYDSDGQLIFSTEMLDASNGIEMILNENHIAGDIMDVFAKLKPGESAEAIVPMWIADNDETLKESSENYRYQIHLYSFKTPEENKLQQEKLMVQLRAEQKLLFDSISTAYSKDYKIYYKKDGLYILIDKKLKIKKKDFIQANQKVKVHYILHLLPEMKALDNSYLREMPIEFTVGKQQVIQGWDLALQQIKPKIKAIILVPSWLGYGFQGTGREIGPNAPLIFNIEILQCSD